MAGLDLLDVKNLYFWLLILKSFLYLLFIKFLNDVQKCSKIFVDICIAY